jgi:sugar-specific transcriptional regulator TrmB
VTPLDPIEPLVALGFTNLEAEIYTFLANESPATGYRIAQALGKPTANTYKAIESLEQKGAIMVDDGATRVCRAIPADELLARLGRDFERRRARAKRTLARLRPDTADDRVYQMRTVEQVFERCRSMLAECRRIALIDIFPEPFAVLRPDIERAAARGVDVALQAYLPVSVAGVDVVVPPSAGDVLDRWPGQQLNVVIDAEQHLLALLESGGRRVLQAVWSQSAYLSCLHHSGLGCELALAALRREVGATDGADIDGNALRRVLARQRKVVSWDNPGYQTLMARHGKPQRGGADLPHTEEGS